ncbi:hypothetical protein Tco_0257753 [Tanacetum coccineum]|uniref:Uncharacterized protein n=1 Tax=Tanacetum coccineum TaxID=301880 RepID=A0ABQ5CJ63_9ASTR
MRACSNPRKFHHWHQKSARVSKLSLVNCVKVMTAEQFSFKEFLPLSSIISLFPLKVFKVDKQLLAHIVHEHQGSELEYQQEQHGHRIWITRRYLNNRRLESCASVNSRSMASCLCHPRASCIIRLSSLDGNTLRVVLTFQISFGLVNSVTRNEFQNRTERALSSSIEIVLAICYEYSEGEGKPRPNWLGQYSWIGSWLHVLLVVMDSFPKTDLPTSYTNFVSTAFTGAEAGGLVLYSIENLMHLEPCHLCFLQHQMRLLGWKRLYYLVHSLFLDDVYLRLLR